MEGGEKRPAPDRPTSSEMKDAITKLLLILLAILEAFTAFIVVMAVAQFASAALGRWAGVTFYAVVAVAAICVVLMLAIPDRGENNGA